MSAFDPRCRRCARLATFLEEVGERHPDYHCAPVAPFGARRPGLLVVGLAPGLHGANRTGRPFTGDHAGILLYQTLHRHGFASAPVSHDRDDGLTLHDCAITNAVKCLPPQNKPVVAEVNACNGFLRSELQSLRAGAVVLGLGAIAHKAVIAAFGLRQAAHPFGHGAEHALPDDRVLLDSYHCSRYNTQTRRLTEPMFDQIFARARTLVDAR